LVLQQFSGMEGTMVKKQKKVRGPLKDWLAGQLRSQIEAGHFPPGSLLAPERELCDSFHVSRVSVRAAIDSMVRAGLVERYPRRGTVVKEPIGGGEKNIPDLRTRHQILFIRFGSNPSSSLHLEGIRRYCREAGVELVFLDAQISHENFLGYLSDISESVGGVLLIPFDTPEYRAAIQQLLDRQIAVVCMGKSLEGLQVSTVDNDEFTGCYVATNHLLSQHHGPVYYLGLKDRPSTARQRYLGWLAAMTEHGFEKIEAFFREIETPEEIMSIDPMRTGYEEGYRISREIFSNPKSDEEGWSVLAINDYVAKGVYGAAGERGLKVGREVRVVGVGDYPFAAKMIPPLSSVSGTPEALGYTGAKLLHQGMTQHPGRVVHQVLPLTLMERESSLGKI
jgi:DNA-binding LacI/PurR family transcriptional regulator/DNA-binding transcriptional regulator YhcF (GntR family)